MSLELRPRPERLPTGHRHPLPDSRRAEPEEIDREVALVARSPVVGALLDAADAVLLVLDRHRQVVAFNACRDGTALGHVAGLRPGEVLGCTQAQHPGGCGTARACESCGALGAITASAGLGRPVEAECLVTSAGSRTPFEFNARATPIEVGGEPFTVLSLRDISSEKRRDALEQVFFHDLLNTVAGLRGWADHLRRPAADVPRATERLDALSRQLEREIRDHRALILAEAGTLVPQRGAAAAAAVLEEVEAVFVRHAVARDRTLEIGGAPRLELETDRGLLVRVLVNMVRNALEATPPGGTVRVACEAWSGGVRFAVHNAGAIPPAVQARIFQRSFSTKAERGRGLGTYGMKLLGERYLGGEVSFVSTEEAGTTFSLCLPLPPPSAFDAARRAATA
ncbi:sensor histidine kinase [Anaeromyxobacter oryzae]|uniref:Sensor histidine kinase n=1 Tax=Anaeromyxobacter oryzae TaxID=2918170 RepID=A0ABN6MSU0_9BACT|nr:HAMP domain-containing sensor histidine kinase [Anaeromyxobacter oryzae]BDG04024.1 sensor histidine kinase [Anaeromyxobacter oryzae]